MSPAGISVDLNEELIKWLMDKRWPNFVNVHDAWNEPGDVGTFCMRMDCAGTTLRICLNLGWRFIGAFWLDIMLGIANGLGQAHHNQIIHGDLKPSNSSSASSID
jgi:serine/threonine protein kinase